MDFFDLYKNCRLCPRACGVDRLAIMDAGAGLYGYCGESSQLRLAFAGLHRGEEPPLSGENGSGTVFVTGCNLRCSFCHYWQISGGARRQGSADGGRLGRAVSADEFAAICFELQNRGAENINIVTGSHAVPAIVQGLDAAKAIGLRIPVLWNSSGYESIAALELLGSHIDTYLPDLKTLDETLAARFFNAPDYPKAAAHAIQWMIKNTNCRVMIRHLILPGYLESSRSVLRWFADNAMAGGALLSLMSQYTPVTENGERAVGSGGGEISRFLSRREYDTVLGWLSEFGIEDGFCQELLTGNDWLPDFTRPNPFSSNLSVPVWNYIDSG
jgi:putative pyruvate formate lyase activating enzyme